MTSEVVPRDAPFHKDESVRIGRVVHASLMGGTQRCYSARVSGHPSGEPDEHQGRVYLAIDWPPFTNVLATPTTVFVMWKPRNVNDLPLGETWHWPRACPHGL
jgi:hypothetical protein